MNGQVQASFRDPSGFVFVRDGVVLRQVNRVYQRAYDHLLASGLYTALTREGWLIEHEERSDQPPEGSGAYRILQPRPLSFVSHPYEWCFSQLKDAALLTLAVQRIAIRHGMSLKDASAYNVQLHEGRMTFIDTLSFEHHVEQRPWVAYRQFCQHFLAPLALMAHTDIGLSQLLRVHLDGIPLSLASRLLPWHTRLHLGLLLHIHLHAQSQRHYASRERRVGPIPTGHSRQKHEAILQSLEGAVRRLRWRGGATEWADYYEANHNYGDAGLQNKERLVREFLERVRPGVVWDFGANTGRFSRLAPPAGARVVVAWDVDPSAVEASYHQVTSRNERELFPLLLDLANPSPALGWSHAERSSLLDRGPADLVLALGLVHHLAIGNNLPLARVAGFMARAGRHLLIEWVPKEDSQVCRMLASREDVFPHYHQAGFEAAFASEFEVVECQQVPGTVRTLYWMKRKTP
jgi:SAM-dependent methyltransferase